MADGSELDPVQESIMIFKDHILSLPLDDAETAIRGLRAYEEDILMERDIELGWHSIIEE